MGLKEEKESLISLSFPDLVRDTHPVLAPGMRQGIYFACVRAGRGEEMQHEAAGGNLL